MKTIVVGCGAIASRWVRVLSADPRVTLVALVDPDPQQIRSLADRHDLHVPGLPSLAQALDACPGAEIVVNLTPPEQHAPVSRAALRAGRHVLTEKPLATSFHDAQQLVRLAEQAGRRLAVMQNRRYDPGFVWFCAQVSGHRGPVAVAADVCVQLHQPGFRTDQPLPVTTDLAVHAFDQVQGIVAAAPTMVSCVEQPLAFLGRHCAVAAITVRFADGSVFSYRGGFTQAGLRTSATGHWRVDGADVAARWGDPGPTRPEPAGQTPGYQRCITAMVDAVSGDGEVTGSTTMLRSMAMLDAALASARSGGGPVAVPAVGDRS